MEENGALRSIARFALNAIFARDPAWLWNPNLELRAVRVGSKVYIRSRTPSKNPITEPKAEAYVVDLEGGTCTCEGFRYYGLCWHIEASPLAEEADEAPWWAPQDFEPYRGPLH